MILCEEDGRTRSADSYHPFPNRNLGEFLRRRVINYIVPAVECLLFRGGIPICHTRRASL